MATENEIEEAFGEEPDAPELEVAADDEAWGHDCEGGESE